MSVILRGLALVVVMGLLCMNQAFDVSSISGGNLVIPVPLEPCDKAVNSKDKRCTGSMSAINKSTCYAFVGADLIDAECAGFIQTTTVVCNTQHEVNVDTNQQTGHMCGGGTITPYSGNCDRE